MKWLSFHLADIEATLQSIDKVAGDREGIAAEEQMILRGSVIFTPFDRVRLSLFQPTAGRSHELH